MTCPKCGKEITELNLWETSGVEVDVETGEVGNKLDHQEYSFDCPECGDSLNGADEIKDIEEKFYGRP